MRSFINRLVLFIFLAISGTFASCEKDPSTDDDHATPHVHTGAIEINLQAMFGDSLLAMSRGQRYLTANNDSVEVSLFRFYLSNMELTDVEGNRISIPDAYFLCDAADGETMNFTLTGIPIGDYQELKLMIGVDSARNVSGSQTGALDPANNMFWSWNSGYIFFKLEGTSPQSQIGGNSIVYHIGGFAGANRAQRTTSIYFGNTTASVTETHTPQILLKADAGQLFYSPHLISIANDPSETAISPFASQLADNYSNMISLIAVVN
jgi:hypothetical protein